MKKGFVFLLIIPLILLLGCDNLGNKTEREITETFRDRTCIGRGIDKIEGYAECTSSSGDTYKGDVRGHNLNGKGIQINSNGDTLDGYFYEGFFVAGKVNRANGDATKGIWSPQGSGSRLELGKIFTKSDGSIELGEFDNHSNFKYGMKKYNDTFYVGDFTFITNNIEVIKNMFKIKSLYNGYVINNNGCSKVSNGKPTDITRTVTKTITNTVYRNNGLKTTPINLNTLGTSYNPYTIKVELK